MLSHNLLLAGDDAYNLTNSLRFRSSASAYLNRTPASTGNRKTWTWSGWIKRGALGTFAGVFGVGVTSNGGYASVFNCIRFTDANVLSAFEYDINTATTFYRLDTTQVFRDPAAWYHIVFAFDSTQATASNRWKLYVNGAQVTAFSSTTYPSQNYDTLINTAAKQNDIGVVTNVYFDGYMDEVNFIDGQALTPTSFGSFNALTGVWQPARYTGTYGTNGFYLPFTNTTSTSTLGNDFSGNSNTWTVNNISLTAGATYDSMTDVPTLTNATAANYAVLNPLGADTPSVSGGTSNGNLTISNSGSNQKRATIICAGADTNKYYWEVTVNGTATGNFPIPGMYIIGAGTYWPGFDGNSIGLYQGGGLYYNGSQVATLTSFANGDVISIAYDASSGKIWFAKNNTWMASGVPSTGASPNYTLPTGVDRVAGGYTGSGYGTLEFNFGQQGFKYTPPTGFVALNTFNLPSNTIVKGSDYFNAVLYTGNSSTTQNINTGISPDFVWIKSRTSGTGHHSLIDRVRGDIALNSNQNIAEYNVGDFNMNTNGTIDVPFYANDYSMNTSGNSYVAWNWKANGTGASNTAGSITSTVSANTSAGFSIVTYISNGVNGATVGHGLGVAPSMVIVKTRYVGTTQAWAVYHRSAGATQYLILNSTAAATTSSTYWNNTAPSSTVFTIGTSNDVNINSSVYTYVAYCFAPIAGYSAFGSYTGNGSADGPFVYTGFRPRFVMIKRSDGVEPWLMLDSARQTYNVMGPYLLANASDAEATFSFIDFTSNGFKIRNTGGSFNTSGGTYIYMAFAENPFKNSLAR